MHDEHCKNTKSKSKTTLEIHALIRELHVALVNGAVFECTYRVCVDWRGGLGDAVYTGIDYGYHIAFGVGTALDHVANLTSPASIHVFHLLQQPQQCARTVHSNTWPRARIVHANFDRMLVQYRYVHGRRQGGARGCTCTPWNLKVMTSYAVSVCK